MGFSTNGSLWGRGPKGQGVIGTVKKIDAAPDIKEQRVKVKLEGGRSEDAIYVPRKFAKYLKPEHKYVFHLEETTFRGGGQARFSGATMIRRTKQEPLEIKENGFGGSSKGGGGSFRNL